MTQVTETVRPEPPGRPQRGMKWEAQRADDAGLAEPGATCRYKFAARDHACGLAAVLFIWRGIRTRVKWNYCAEHAAKYGCWIEDGAVWRWVQVPDA